MTVADGYIFQKVLKTVSWAKNVLGRTRYYFYSGITMTEFLCGWKVFLNYFALKMILLNTLKMSQYIHLHI